MTADGGVVAEDFIFGDRFARPYGVVEVGLVVDSVAIAGRVGVGLAFRVGAPLEGRGFRMIFVPLLQILVAQRLRPAEDRIAFWFGRVSCGL